MAIIAFGQCNRAVRRDILIRVAALSAVRISAEAEFPDQSALASKEIKMRMRSAFAVAALAAALAGCTNIPLMNNIPLWAGDREKIAHLGKGAPAADVDKAFGHSRILWSKTVDEAGKAYLFRLYDSVEPTNDQRHHMEPYAVVFAGPELRLHAWGPLSELRDSADPSVAAMVPELTLHYTAYRLESR